MRVTKSVANHGHIHFGGRVDRASVNLTHTFDGKGDGTGGGLPGSTDVDVPVAKGSALEKAIHAVAKLLAAGASKKMGVPVTVVEPEKATPTAKTPAKKAVRKRAPAAS